MKRRRATLLFACAVLALAVGAAGRSAHAVERPAAAGAPKCDTANLLAGQMPAAQAEVRGNPALITDGTVAREGTAWDAPAAVTLASHAASITYDLGEPRKLGAFYLQADANDTYKIAWLARRSARKFSGLGRDRERSRPRTWPARALSGSSR